MCVFLSDLPDKDNLFPSVGKHETYFDVTCKVSILKSLSLSFFRHKHKEKKKSGEERFTAETSPDMRTSSRLQQSCVCVRRNLPSKSSSACFLH